MFCKYCGEQILNTSKWCGHCGKEAPPLYRYRKAVQRAEVLNKSAKPADSSAKSAECRDAGPGPAGDLQSFMENTVAVNEVKSLFDGEATQPGGPAFYGETTQVGGPAFYGETTQPGGPAFYGETTQVGGPAFYGEATQPGGSAYQKDADERTSGETDPDKTERSSFDRGSHRKESGALYSFSSGGTANAQNPAASFNRSGDLVGYPGEEEISTGSVKAKKETGKKKASRKSVHIIAGIASVVLIAGLVGFGLGRIFPKSSGPGADDQVQTVSENGITEQGPVPGSEEGDAQDKTSRGEGPESTDSPVESGITESNESGSGSGQDQSTGADDTYGPGGGVNHDTRDVVSEAIADTEGVDPGTADNITEKNVNGPNVSGDVQVNS